MIGFSLVFLVRLIGTVHQMNTNKQKQQQQGQKHQHNLHISHTQQYTPNAYQRKINQIHRVKGNFGGKKIQ